MCEAGYGEIELHLHHGETRPDTAQNLKETILKCIEDYSKFGIFGSVNGRKRYGFIHGDWALANSLDGRCCGVNDEIAVLNRTGCYADFTFPSPEPEASPRQINSIYYADSDPHRPKSYNKGAIVRVGGCQGQGLMIIQGPVFPFLAGNKVSSLRCTADSVTKYYPISNTRINGWVNTGIHVSGKKNWIIIKTHTHGAVDSEQALGEEMNYILGYLEKKYNDGKSFILHYVTARELYNIIKAVEAGEGGQNPEEYRDYEVKAPKYQSTRDIFEASDALKTLLAFTMMDGKDTGL